MELTSECVLIILIVLFSIAIIGLLVLIVSNFNYRKNIMEEIYRDSLTNIYNRRFGFEQIYNAYDNETNEAFPLVLIMADIDDFKSYNDKYGHPCGDVALICVAEAISKNKSVIAYRYGGEEFMIICTGKTVEFAENLAEEIRISVENLYDCSENNLKRKITISVGIAIAQNKTRGVEQLLKQVDDAMYESKRKGKNQITTYK